MRAFVIFAALASSSCAHRVATLTCAPPSVVVATYPQDPTSACFLAMAPFTCAGSTKICAKLEADYRASVDKLCKGAK